MKAIARRIQRLESRLAPQEDLRACTSPMCCTRGADAWRKQLDAGSKIRNRPRREMDPVCGLGTRLRRPCVVGVNNSRRPATGSREIAGDKSEYR